jgi:hypothetical protein
MAGPDLDPRSSHCPIRSCMSVKRCSVVRLNHPIPLHDSDSFIQSLGCPKVLQDPLAIPGSSVPDQSQDGSIAFESFPFGSLTRYADSGRVLAASLLQDAGAAGWSFAITLFCFWRLVKMFTGRCSGQLRRTFDFRR